MAKFQMTITLEIPDKKRFAALYPSCKIPPPLQDNTGGYHCPPVG